MPAVAPPAAGAANALGYVRLLPVGCNFNVRSVPAWAHGMAVAQSAGPLIDERGIASFIDTIVPAAPTLAIVRAPAGSVIAYVQSDSFSETSADGTTTVTFGAGSVWFIASGLVVAAPANAYAGIAFSAATLTVPGGLWPSVVPEWNLPAATTASFSLAPAPAAAAAPGLINDGTQAVATLPSTVVFALAPAGVRVTELAAATLAAYGESIALTGTSAPVAVTYDPAALALTIPFAGTDAAQFTIVANTSPTLQVSGTAPIGGASYRIPVALTTPANLGPPASGGALALALGAGLHARWGNLASDVLAADARLQIETGSLELTLTSTARPFVDTYALWDATASDGTVRATSISLTGPRGAQIIAGRLDRTRRR